MKWILAKFLILIVISFQVVHAHPVAYKGSYSIMTWNSEESSDWMFTHSFTNKYSLSARYQRIETTTGERVFYFPHANVLLKRWNELASQANIYLSAGHGVEKIQRKTDNVTFLGLETDWESREYYISLKEEILLSNKGEDLYLTRVRGGFAPYLAQFDELNSWFILQVEHMNKGQDTYTITPLIRMFYQNVLIETGVNQKGQSQFNFMVHF